MAKEAPVRFGPFDVLGRLGAGGMGEVYRARDSRLNRDVAIKVLLQATADPAQQRRLTAEAQAASALNHPNILTVHDVGVQDDVPYIVSELVDGTSLRSLLARAPLPVREVLSLGVQMADGLAAAHQAGIVHRDFKPENVMVTREGRAKILDFGLALVGTQAGASQLEATLTQSHVIQGTVPYMSPEQARGAQVDFRTDQFSLGSTLYEMVTGRRAFKAETTPQTLARILEDEPESIANLNARVPVPLRWVIERCLAKDPQHRYQSTLDLARELHTLRDRLPELTSNTDIAPATPLHRRWSLRLALVAGAAALAIGVLLLRGGSEDGFDQYRLTPFATDSGYQSSPAWSPDGKTVAYVATVDGVLQVFTKAIGSPLRNQVTRSRWDCFHPFWSADGTRLYYVSLQGPRLGLLSISIGGGDAELVSENVTRAALSPDGKTLALWRASGGDDAGGYTLWLASPADSPAVHYTRGPFGERRFLQGVFGFSHDSSKLAVFTVVAGKGEVSYDGSSSWVVPMSGADPYELPESSDRRVSLGLSWLPDNRHIVHSAPYPVPGNHLWLRDTNAGSSRLLLASGGIEAEPAVSRDGRIAMAVQQLNYDIHRLSVERPSLEPVFESSRNEMDPAWSQLISKMVLTTDRSGADEIWLGAQDGELDRLLVSEKDFSERIRLMGSPALSPDGRSVAYYVRGVRNSRIWIKPVAGGPATQIAYGAEQDMPSWSPDSLWIAYVHQDENTPGTWSLSKARVGKTTAAPVRLAPNIDPNSPVKWAPSNAWIAFMGDGGLSLVSPDGQHSRTVADQAWLAFDWSEDSRRLFGIRQSDDYRNLTFASIDIASGEERVLAANLAPVPVASRPVRGFTRTSATTFLTSIVRVSSDIWLLDGFQPPQSAWERQKRRMGIRGW